MLPVTHHTGLNRPDKRGCDGVHCPYLPMLRYTPLSY
ncbi:Uncharacterised protein [Vibrio cholerae]|nr:Uncharacterised protein [Vibrio cholerae]